MASRVVPVIIGILVAFWVAVALLVGVVWHSEQSSQPSVALPVLDRSGAEQITYSGVTYSRTAVCRPEPWLASHHSWLLVVVGHVSSSTRSR